MTATTEWGQLLERARGAAADWQAALEAKGGLGWKQGIVEADTLMEIKAGEFLDLGTAYLDLQPGNGTSYKMVLHDTDYIPARLSRRDRREYHGASSAFGGRLLVAIPELGRSMCCAMVPMLTPDFIEEQMLLRYGDAVPVAIALTLFCTHVYVMEREGSHPPTHPAVIDDRALDVAARQVCVQRSDHWGNPDDELNARQDARTAVEAYLAAVTS